MTVIQVDILYWKRLPKIFSSIGKKIWGDESRINEIDFMSLLIFKTFLEENLHYLNQSVCVCVWYVKVFAHW